MSLASRTIDRPKIYRFAGDTLRLALVLVDPDDDSPFNPTGQILLFTLKDDLTKPDDQALVQKLSTIGGFTVIDTAAGRVDLQLVPLDLEALVAGVQYECDVQAQDSETDEVKTVARFSLKLSQDVTREVVLSIPTHTTNPAAGYTWENIPDRPAELQVDPGTAGGVATLGDDGKVKASQIPALAIGDTYVVDSQVEMLALGDEDVPAEKGDVAIRSDLNLSFILQGDDPSVLSNWVQLRSSGGDLRIASNLSDLADTAQARINLGITATGADTTYCFRANNLSDLANAAAARANLGLGNVDNTSDANKPISTAAQAALDLKAPLASPAFTGTPTAPTASAATATTQLATTAFVAAAIANLINSAPGALDTLKELADALGDDANFAATMTTALATKAAKAANLSDLADAAAARVNLGLGTVENTALSTWAGTTNITTLGTIATGVWHGTAIAVAYGGTGSAYFTVAGPTATRTYTFPDANATIARTDAGQTFTGTNNFAGLTATSITDSGLTSGRIPFSSTGGLLADSSALLYNETANGLTIDTLNGSGSPAPKIGFAGKSNGNASAAVAYWRLIGFVNAVTSNMVGLWLNGQPKVGGVLAQDVVSEPTVTFGLDVTQDLYALRRFAAGSTVNNGNYGDLLSIRGSLANNQALLGINFETNGTSGLPVSSISSGTTYGVALNTRYNQSGTASGIDWLVDRLSNTVGSGEQLLAALRLAGASKWKVDTSGNVTQAGILAVTATTAATSTTTGSLVNSGGFGNAGAAYIGGKLFLTTTGNNTRGIAFDVSGNRTLYIDSVGRFRFDPVQASTANAVWLDNPTNAQSNALVFATSGTSRFTISQASSGANVIFLTDATGGVAARGMQFSPNNGSGSNLTALDIQYASVTFGTSITMPNNVGIAFKDSAGTAVNCLSLLSDNTCLVGTQSTPTSNGHLLLYVNGSEAARFFPTSLAFKVNSSTSSTSSTTGAIVIGTNVGLSGSAGGNNWFGGPIIVSNTSNAYGFQHIVGQTVSSKMYTGFFAGNTATNQGAGIGWVYDSGTPANSFFHVTPYGTTEGSLLKMTVGGTLTLGALLQLGAATTARASLNIPGGAAPTSPNDGDVWFDGTNFKARVGGATKQFTLT